MRTASFLQVREPLYPTSIGKYRFYVYYLGELARILGVGLNSPALTSERPA